MTVTTQPRGARLNQHLDWHPLPGFAPVLRKELAEWVRGRRALVVGAIATVIATLGALSSWLQQTVGDMRVNIGDGASQTTHAYSTDPTVTTLALFQIPLVPILAILATISLIAAERESGTLAWSLTKPVSRTAVLVAKWSGAMLAFGLVALVIPIGVSAIASTLAYGSAPDMGIVTKTCGLYLAVPALLIALTLFAGVVIRSQATIAGLALFVMFAPALLGSFLPPQVVRAVPVGIGNWVLGYVAGDTVPPSTPIAWAVTLAVLLGASIKLFERQEL